jgi:bla regulator protein blaR1
MGLESVIRGAELILAALGRASLQGSLLILGIWVLVRSCPRLPTFWQCWLWWLACLKLALALVWIAPLRLPILPAEPVVVVKTVAVSLRPGAPPASPASDVSAFAPSRSSPPTPFPWRPLLAGVWGAGLLFQILRTARDFGRVRRILRRSEPVSTASVAELFAQLRKALGIRKVDLRNSSEVQTPQVLGLFRPVVLLPYPRVERLDRQELTMALCHELLHVRRRDLWYGWVPVLARRLFFFHPLATLACREYTLAREAACDAEVVRVLDATPRIYGRLLLRWGVKPQPSRLAAAGAASSFVMLKRRIQMLQQSSNVRRRLHPGWWCLIGLAALATLVQVRVEAQNGVLERAMSTARGEPRAAVATSRAATRPAPQGETARSAGAAPARAAQSTGQRPQWMVEPGYHWRGDADSDAYVFVGNAASFVSASDEDVARAERALRGQHGLWFERGGRAYLVRDAATLDQVQTLFRPQMEHASRLEQPSPPQADLKERETELMQQDAELRQRETELAAQRSAVVAEQDRRVRQARPADELTSQLQELNRQQDEIIRQRDDIRKREDELSEERAKLWQAEDAMSEEGRRMAREAERQLRALMERAVASGAAQEVER